MSILPRVVNNDVQSGFFFFFSFFVGVVIQRSRNIARLRNTLLQLECKKNERGRK